MNDKLALAQRCQAPWQTLGQAEQGPKIVERTVCLEDSAGEVAPFRRMRDRRVPRDVTRS
jgi:hypothetical protein